MKPNVLRLWVVALLVALPLMAHVRMATAQPLPGAPNLSLNEQLIEAADRGETATVLRLLAEGAYIDARDARGRTALMAATHGNHIETANVLIQAGADVDIRDGNLDSPLLYAAAQGQLQILQLLVARGADLELADTEGMTALQRARARGFDEIARILEQARRMPVATAEATAAQHTEME